MKTRSGPRRAGTSHVESRLGGELASLFSRLVARDDPKAVRHFIHTCRRAASKQDAWEKLGISRATFYRLHKTLQLKGHTL